MSYPSNLYRTFMEIGNNEQNHSNFLSLWYVVYQKYFSIISSSNFCKVSYTLNKLIVHSNFLDMWKCFGSKGSFLEYTIMRWTYFQTWVSLATLYLLLNFEYFIPSLFSLLTIKMVLIKLPWSLFSNFILSFQISAYWNSYTESRETSNNIW